MKKIQIITSPAGEEMVVIAKADYDAMVAALDAAAEDTDDVAIYDARKKEMAAEGGWPAIYRNEGDEGARKQSAVTQPHAAWSLVRSEKNPE